MLSMSICNSLCPRTNIFGLFNSPTPPAMVMTPKCLVQINCSSSSSSSSSLVIAKSGIRSKPEVAFRGPTMTTPENDLYEQAGLQRELMPKHVAASLDGNRRWAKAHGKELDYYASCYGYLALAGLCIKWDIPTLSCIIFSTENWKRTKEASDLVFNQFKRCLEESQLNFIRKGIRVVVTGEKTGLPEDLQEVLKQVEEGTKNNSKVELNFAVGYGGKWDIVQAIRSISKKAKAREIELQDVNEPLMDQQLTTNCLQFPDPDLFIRTGGDQRISNFLVWQMSHTEFYFTDVLGPDFREPHFIDALRWFQQSGRLFGK